MRALAEQAASDIKNCANACDTYSKKKLLVKVLMGAAWEGRLTDFLDRFTKIRSEFKMALAMHTARNAVDIKGVVHGIDGKCVPSYAGPRSSIDIYRSEWMS